jgi:hypothetical protein
MAIGIGMANPIFLRPRVDWVSASFLFPDNWADPLCAKQPRELATKEDSRGKGEEGEEDGIIGDK